MLSALFYMPTQRKTAQSTLPAHALAEFLRRNALLLLKDKTEIFLVLEADHFGNRAIFKPGFCEDFGLGDADAVQMFRDVNAVPLLEFAGNVLTAYVKSICNIIQRHVVLIILLDKCRNVMDQVLTRLLLSLHSRGQQAH